MKRRWPSRVVIVAALAAAALATAAILLGKSASAGDRDLPTTVADRDLPTTAADRDLPTSAADFGQEHLACPLGSGPFPDLDLWIFTADSGGATLTFVQPGSAEPEVRTVEHGTGKISTPAGWTLVVVPPGVTLTATCPAAPLVVPPSTPRARARALPVRTTTPADETSTPAYDPVVPRAAASLPNTGLDVGGMVILGSALVVAGALLLIVRRRPDPAPAPAAALEPMIWVRSTQDPSGDVVIPATITPR